MGHTVPFVFNFPCFGYLLRSLDQFKFCFGKLHRKLVDTDYSLGGVSLVVLVSRLFSG